MSKVAMAPPTRWRNGNDFVAGSLARNRCRRRRGCWRSVCAWGGGGAVFDHANRQWVAPADEHRFTAGSDAVPETRGSHGPAPPPPTDTAAAPQPTTTTAARQV